jgi:predicted GIY-YIG superfamily endonuclease
MVAICCVVIFILLLLLAVLWLKTKKRSSNESVEIDKEQLEMIARYARQHQTEEQCKLQKRQDKKDLMRVQMETFKQTKEELKSTLKSQIDQKEWQSLDSILSSTDKGGIGIYILYNATRDKYYVGQAKQIFKRIRDHFAIEDIARDYHLEGDTIKVKFLTANELSGDYRIDHIEKTGIEIFNSDKAGYNKTGGNV